jgi:hypothetical protein
MDDSDEDFDDLEDEEDEEGFDEEVGAIPRRCS